MDSYFATLEQQANPFLRGKPVGVSGKEDSRTVIVAASREAKQFGVKTAMSLFEARKLCPQMYLVEGDGPKYRFVTDEFIKIFKRVSSQVEIYSIDEAFLDLTGYVNDFKAARIRALWIKEQLKIKAGEWVTCSIGIAKNKLLAKVASDLNKPNGLVVINDTNLFNIIDKLKLTDFWGLGPRINRRLEAMGIETVKKLRAYPVAELIKEFGLFYGRKLHDMVRGEDVGSVVSDYNEPAVKSVSRAYTLDRDTWDKGEIFQVLAHLCYKCGRELRRKKIAGRTLEYYWRYDDFTHAGFRFTLKKKIDDGLELFKIGQVKLIRYDLAKAVRLVGVRVANLEPVSGQQLLFTNERKWQRLGPFLDQINDTYGELTIKSAYLVKKSRLRNKIGGFKYGD